MSKKIYDVMPPKVAHKVENTIKSLGAKNTKKRRTKKVVSVAKEEKKEFALKPVKRFPVKEILFGITIIVILIGIYLLNKLPRVEVQILPTLDVITLQDKITASKSVSSINLDKKIIPLHIVESVKESSQEFPATGIASNDGKATGSMTIYNKASPSTAVTLVSGTHFLSDSGKYFVTLAKVTIPAMKGKTPGSVSVKVQAKEVGSDYNIGSSKFSVPKLSGTAYYYSIWGESKEDMSGGYTGKVKKVTKDDLDSAKDVLTKKLLQDAESSLRSKVSEDEILLDGATLSNVVEVKSDQKAGAIADKFNQSATVKVLALVIKKQDLETFVIDSIMSQLSDEKTLLKSSLDLSYNEESVNFDKGMEVISLRVSAKAYYDMDVGNLSDLFKRKSSNEIREIINSQYGEKISNTKVDFWPFWVSKAPKDINRIKVNIVFE